jgi:aminoglycoside phosphotransferase (APT) family kinase protein
MEPPAPLRSPEALLRDYAAYGLPFTQQPRLLRELRGGRTNRSYLIEVHGQRLVLRLNSNVAHALGVDRDREAKILRLASARGWSAPVVHNDPRTGLLVTEYLDGRSPDPTDPRLPDRLGRLLEEVHALAIDLPRFDYLAHEETLWRAAHAAGFAPPPTLCAQRSAMRIAIAHLRAHAPTGCLCHHDPTPENVIDAGGHLYLLDWEYGAFGDHWFDHAVLAASWQPFVPISRKALEPQHLVAAVAVYNYICALWTQAALASTHSRTAVLDSVAVRTPADGDE